MRPAMPRCVLCHAVAMLCRAVPCCVRCRSPRQARRGVVPHDFMVGESHVELLCRKEGMLSCEATTEPRHAMHPTPEQPACKPGQQKATKSVSPPTWDASGTRRSAASASSGTCSASAARQGSFEYRGSSRITPASSTRPMACSAATTCKERGTRRGSCQLSGGAGRARQAGTRHEDTSTAGGHKERVPWPRRLGSAPRSDLR